MSSQGRRKHSACLFRMRENCPFRKLRRSMSNDVRSPLVPTGGHWRTRETPPQAGPSVSNCDIKRTVEVETFSRPPLSASHLLQEEFSAMDTDMDAPPSPSQSYTVSDDPGSSNFHHAINNHPSSNSTITDVGSGVDPETGERAQHCRQIQYLW